MELLLAAMAVVVFCGVGTEALLKCYRSNSDSFTDLLSDFKIPMPPYAHDTGTWDDKDPTQPFKWCGQYFANYTGYEEVHGIGVTFSKTGWWLYGTEGDTEQDCLDEMDLMAATYANQISSPNDSYVATMMSCCQQNYCNSPAVQLVPSQRLALFLVMVSFCTTLVMLLASSA